MYNAPLTGLIAPPERHVDVTVRLANSTKPYLDLYEMLESEGLRMEPTRVTVTPEGQFTYGVLDVTLVGDPDNYHAPVTIQAYVIHEMRIKKIWRAGTTATQIVIFGIMV